MGIQSVRCAIPFCTRVAEEQTKCSLYTRIAAVGLGSIALLVGILALSGIPGLSSLGSVGGAVSTSIGGSLLLAGLCFRCVHEAQQIIPTQQLRNDLVEMQQVRNDSIDWKTILEGSMREPHAPERVEVMLQGAAISTCPYKKIIVKLAYETSPILTFEEDGAFSHYTKNLPCGPTEVLFIQIPTTQAQSDRFKRSTHLSTSTVHPDVKVSYLSYEEWCSGHFSPEALKRLGFS